MGTCSGCGKIVIWTVTVNNKRMPVDPHPSEEGNVELEKIGIGRDGFLYKALVYGPLEAMMKREEGVDLRTSHFATCPEAESFRKKDRSG